MLVGGMPYPPVAGYAPIASVKTFDGFTGTTSKSVTDSSVFEGTTPLSALLMASAKNITDDPGGSPHAVFNVGIADIGAASNNKVHASSQNGLASTSVRRVGYDGTSSQAFISQTPGSAYQLTRSMITDGLTLTSNTTTNQRVGAAIFGGPGIARHATGNVNMGTGTSAITVTLGFEADFIICFGVQDNLPGGFSSLFAALFGIVTKDGVQRSLVWIEGNGQPASTAAQSLRTDAAVGQLFSGSGSYLAPVAITPTGFTVTPTASTGGDKFVYLAIKLATGRSAKLLDVDTPTTTGIQTISGAGFAPSFGISVMSFLEAANEVPTSFNIKHSGMGVGLFNTTGQFAMSQVIGVGSDPTVTGSNSYSGTALMSGGGTDSAAIRATLDGFTSDGVRFNYSAVDAVSKKGFVLLVA